MTKIKDNQLQKLQDFVNSINQGQLQLGQLETQKHSVLHYIADIQKNLNDFQQELEKEYGPISINIQDGTYTEIKEEDEPNKEN